MCYYYETNYLSHHGIKGQHWGIRRYQNKDGSLTAKGVARNASRSAQMYYKEKSLQRTQKNTHDFKTYRDSMAKEKKTRSKREKIEATISKNDINRGRMRYASMKNIQSASLSGLSAVATVGAAALAGANAIWTIPMGAVTLGGAAAVGALTRHGTRGGFYRKEKNAYAKALKNRGASTKR